MRKRELLAFVAVMTIATTVWFLATTPIIEKIKASGPYGDTVNGKPDYSSYFVYVDRRGAVEVYLWFTKQKGDGDEELEAVNYYDASRPDNGSITGYVATTPDEDLSRILYEQNNLGGAFPDQFTRAFALGEIMKYSETLKKEFPSMKDAYENHGVFHRKFR